MKIEMSLWRRIGGWSALMLLCAALPGQIVSPPPQHESVVINIEVPVRVWKGDAFMDGLTLADFEVYESGVRQSLEAVYLIKDKTVLREEKAPGSQPPRPQEVRNYVLYLELKEYISEIGEALDYFFSEVLEAGDALFVVTPVKTYTFHSEVFSVLSRRQVSDGLKDILKKDIQNGSSKYRQLMRDFYRLEEEEVPADYLDVKESRLFELARQMRDLTEITESRVMGFADALKTLKGEKHVFLMLQRDVLPGHDFSFDRWAKLMKPVAFDVDKLKRYFSDAAITVHSLYITKTPGFVTHPMKQTGSVNESMLQDLSSDIYASFREMAAATGGLSESTTNPNFALRHAAEASGNYYLLYYRPVDYRADGKFRKIEVRVRGEGLKVTHRLGYIAD
jgi:VWFA-related protein